MSAIPKLSRWSIFVRSLGGYVGLDVDWQKRAWAEFAHPGDGDLAVVCRLDDGGDVDVTVRPTLEGAKIRKHARLAQALAAFAYLNPASKGNGEAVSRDAHKGEWYPLSEDLAVAVAVNGSVGGVEVGGRGAFLLHKGRLWLPHGHQVARDGEAGGMEPVDSEAPQISPSRPSGDVSVQSGPAVAAAKELSRPGMRAGADTGHDGATVSPLRASQPRPRPPREPRTRIFGEATDELISQARSAGRGRT